MKKTLLLIGLVAYLVFQYTKPVYAVSISAKLYIMVGVGVVAFLILLLWVILSLLLVMSERSK